MGFVFFSDNNYFFWQLHILQRVDLIMFQLYFTFSMRLKQQALHPFDKMRNNFLSLKFFSNASKENRLKLS
ncbi:MAG: hypothetical protein CVU39_12070 [Chloroflexi bacterium HGW-Chloroflexi-10]|nr:MAG: hypothetical protein CVU39_12070 [Chloroflexi bacterium HGW-Chloroflexi-10]